MAEEEGPLTRYLVGDHRRLDALLQSAVADALKVDYARYDHFRAGLLRHIGIEEKILLPSLQRLQGGVPFPHAARLQLDHGALAALLMPAPTVAIISAIRAILAAHNVLEERRGGLYETCDALAKPEVDALLARMKAAAEVTVMPHSDSPAVMKTLRGVLERAGYHLNDYEVRKEEANSLRATKGS